MVMKLHVACVCLGSQMLSRADGAVLVLAGLQGLACHAVRLSQVFQVPISRILSGVRL